MPDKNWRVYGSYSSDLLVFFFFFCNNFKSDFMIWEIKTQKIEFAAQTAPRRGSNLFSIYGFHLGFLLLLISSTVTEKPLFLARYKS